MCWCTSKACKYKKRKHNVGHDGFLIKCNIGYKNHTAYRSLIAEQPLLPVLDVFGMGWVIKRPYQGAAAEMLPKTYDPTYSS